MVSKGVRIMMRLEDLIRVVDVLTVVEIIKTGDRTLFKGKFKDIQFSEMTQYNVYRINPCSTSRETYLEIDVY